MTVLQFHVFLALHCDTISAGNPISYVHSSSAFLSIFMSSIVILGGSNPISVYILLFWFLTSVVCVLEFLVLTDGWSTAYKYILCDVVLHHCVHVCVLISRKLPQNLYNCCVRFLNRNILPIWRYHLWSRS